MIQPVGTAVGKVISRWAKSDVGKPALEGQRHLFLRHREDLPDEEEQSRASLALAFPEIGSAWQLKADLRCWYETAEASTTASRLDAWIAHVKSNGPAELRTALSAFGNWRQEILAFFDEEGLSPPQATRFEPVVRHVPALALAC